VRLRAHGVAAKALQPAAIAYRHTVGTAQLHAKLNGLPTGSQASKFIFRAALDFLHVVLMHFFHCCYF
jgi:hypothetical protein